MGRERVTKWVRLLLIVGVLLLTIYVIGIFFFKARFVPNTKLNGIDVAFRTPVKAEEKLNRELKESVLTFYEADEALGHISLDQLGAEAQAGDTLQELIQKQNPYIWPAYLVNGRQVESSDCIQFDDNQIATLLAGLGVNNDERQTTHSARLVQTDTGSLEVQEEIYGNQISVASMESALQTAISQGKANLALEDAYILPELTSADHEFQDRSQYIEHMAQVSISLEFDGQTVTIPQDRIRSWLDVDEHNELVIDIEAIEDYVYELNEQYSQLFANHDFHSTYQGWVNVASGTYGWYIDKYAEAQAIVQDILAGQDIVRPVNIAGSGYGMEDFGGDYVEVDLTYQMMFVYRNYELVLQTPIVSGKSGADTIPGAYQVWEMKQDTDLVGYNPFTEKEYSQPVDYWIAFDNQAQGIHDASWQASFGGDMWVANGSLGCINTPPSVMPQVFDLVYVGMPVLVFH